MPTDDRETKELTAFAKEVIRKAGEEALAFYGRGKSTLKFDEGLITEAELHLTEFFQRQLDGRYPGHRLFENAQKGNGYTHEENRHLWVYDPLDGIANFQAGIPLWGNSLALLENHWPLFGLFHMPATGDLFHAKAGGKPFWGDEEISVTTLEGIDNESLLLTYSRFHRHFRTTFPGKIRNLGSTAAHLCYVATGRAEGAVIANESYQGLAAVRVILKAAGGNLFRLDGSPFPLEEYADGEHIHEPILAAAPETVGEIGSYLEKVDDPFL